MRLLELCYEICNENQTNHKAIKIQSNYIQLHTAARCDDMNCISVSYDLKVNIIKESKERSKGMGVIDEPLSQV